MARTGCRPSESRALQVRDIDFPRGIIRINRVNPVHGEERTGSKTGRSRQIDMTPELASLLRAHIDSIPGAAFKKDIPLFISEAGTSIDWSNAIRVFERICRKAKITPEGQDCPFSPYCLRHSVASVLLAERAELTYVSNLLGHADCATTLRFYAHHIPSNGERYVDRLDHAKIVKER
jgi:integrase